MSETEYDANPTIDPNEIAKLKSSCSEWWDINGIAKLLHTLNELRVPWIVDAAAEIGLISNEQSKDSKSLQGLKILDVGCGVGILSEPLAQLGGTVIGIDPCAEIIQEAKRHQGLDSSLTNLTYLAETTEQHAEENPEKYDIVVASEVVDHVGDQDLFLELCCKCLKPGGAIFITTFTKTWTSWFMAIIFYEYIWGCIVRGSHSWHKFITPEDVGEILKKYNCGTKQVRGQRINFPDKTWQWTSNPSISYALCAVKEKK